MTAREWFTKAQEEGFAIGAFNVDNLEIFNAICIAAQNKKSPVMMEFSQGEVGYFGIDNIVDLVVNAREQFGVPILLNLDHAKRVEECLAVMAHPRGVHGSSQAHPGGEESVSFDLIHFDGSDLPYEANVEEVKKVVEAAHAQNLLVEGEIDKVSGSSVVHNEELDMEKVKKSYTDPAKAKKFVEETGVDIFAAVFGNVHGTFPEQPDLDMELLKKIKEALGDTFISMHGGSGIPADQVREAIKVGKIVKVNVNTELRQAYKDAFGEKLVENPEEYAMYKFSQDVVMAVAAVVEGKINVFGSNGKV